MAIKTDVVEAKLTALSTQATTLKTLLNSNQSALEALQVQTYYGIVESALEEVQKSSDALTLITANLTQLGYS